MVKMTPLFMFLFLSATKELVRGGCTPCDSPPPPCKSCVQPPVHVREGEMAVLQCPLRTTRAGHREGNLTLAWSNHSGPGDLQEPAVWRSEDTLIILRVSPNEQGSYSCSLLDASGQALRTAWFNITVFSGQCYTQMDVYASTCYLRQSCEKLTCTSDSIQQNFTKHNYTWYKNCDTELPSDFGDGYLTSASESDSGYYTCTSYYTYNSNLHDEQVFTLSRTMKRTVKEGSSQVKPQIIGPRDGEVIKVDMETSGQPVKNALLQQLHSVDPSLWNCHAYPAPPLWRTRAPGGLSLRTPVTIRYALHGTHLDSITLLIASPISATSPVSSPCQH